MDKDRVAGAAKDAAGKVEGAVGDLAGNAETRASGRLREASGTVQNLYGQRKAPARGAADTAASFDRATAEAKQVRDNPLGALLLAGGIGFALAMILTRPPRRSRR